MTKLDDLSLMLGELKSDARHVVKWCEEHEEKDAERFQVITEQLSAIAVPLQKLSILEHDIEKAKPVIEFVHKAKWILGGVLALLSVLGGAASGIAAQALKWLQ